MTEQETERYNGWANRETWAVALHINNDQGWQESVFEALREAQAEHVPDPEDADMEGGETISDYFAGTVIQGNVEDIMEPTPTDPKERQGWVLSQGQWLAVQDIGSLWRVDWTELGASFLADLAESGE